MSDKTALRPFQLSFRKRSSPSCADASLRHVSQSKKPLPTFRRAYRSRPCRNSRAIGGRNMTGAGARRGSMPCRISSPRSTIWIFTSSMCGPSMKRRCRYIVTHGWPGSIVEQLKLIEPLTNPTAHGGSAADAFHVVIPSIPGYGFSGKPTTTGSGAERIARAWDVLMKRLGYSSYVAQGGDWGAIVAELMGAQAPKGTAGRPHQYAPGDTACHRRRGPCRARRCRPDFPRMKSIVTKCWRPSTRTSTTASSWPRAANPGGVVGLTRRPGDLYARP